MKKNHKLITLIFLLLFTICGCATQKDDNINHSTEPEKPQITKATIGCTGDILIHTPVLSSVYDKKQNSYNFNSIFENLKEYVDKVDYAVINLEGTLAEGNFTGYPCFKVPDSIVDAVKQAGFDMCLTANNHSNDGGNTGFARTMDVLAQRGMDFIGTRKNIEDKKYLIKEINGIKFGMVNYTYGEINSNGIIATNGIPAGKENSKLINIFDYNKLDNFYNEQTKIIEEMKNNDAEVIIYYMHWGTEYQIKENEIQRKIAKKLSDLGVDVIIGGHPHVVQPIERITSPISEKETICIYSMGNAISNQMATRMDLKTGHTEDGVFFMVTFTKTGDAKISMTDLKILPTWVNLRKDNYGKNIYSIIPLDKETDWSAKFSLTEEELKMAERSYNRTTAIIGTKVE